MTANNDLNATDSAFSDDKGIIITGRIGSGKNFDLLSRAVAAQRIFSNRPGSDLSYMALSSAASTSISDLEPVVK